MSIERGGNATRFVGTVNGPEPSTHAVDEPLCAQGLLRPERTPSERMEEMIRNHRRASSPISRQIASTPNPIQQFSLARAYLTNASSAITGQSSIQALGCTSHGFYTDLAQPIAGRNKCGLVRLRRANSISGNMEIIRRLGFEIERAWQDVDYASAIFPELAAEHLKKAAVHEHVTGDAILDWALTTLELPAQADPKAEFGEPPITLYMGCKFHITALFWVDSTTEIHQHGFRGAFQVLAGSSLHTSYTFMRDRTITGTFQVGRLEPRASQLLRTGDVEPIFGGDGSIHALFHLERPSVSLVVRTMSEPNLQPQYSYVLPGIAYDPFFEEPRMLRTLQIAGLLRTLDDPRLEERITRAIACSDVHSCFLLLKMVRSVRDTRVFARLLDTAAQRHGTIVQTFATAFLEIARQESIVLKRAQVKDAEHRFFLALLLNVASRRQILALTQTYVPHRDPVETLVTWLVALSKVKLKLQLGGRPWEPNAFGLPEFDEGILDALRSRLRGEPLEAIPHPDHRHGLEALARIPTFGPLFSD